MITPGYAPPGMPTHTADELPIYCAVFVAVAAAIFLWDRLEKLWKKRRAPKPKPREPRWRDPTAGVTVVRITLRRPLTPVPHPRDGADTIREVTACLLRHRDAWSEGSVSVDRAADRYGAWSILTTHTRAASLVLDDRERRSDVVTLAVAMTGEPVAAPWGCQRADVIAVLEALAALEPARLLDARAVWLIPDDAFRARGLRPVLPG